MAPPLVPLPQPASLPILCCQAKRRGEDLLVVFGGREVSEVRLALLGRVVAVVEKAKRPPESLVSDERSR